MQKHQSRPSTPNRPSTPAGSPSRSGSRAPPPSEQTAQGMPGQHTGKCKTFSCAMRCTLGLLPATAKKHRAVEFLLIRTQGDGAGKPEWLLLKPGHIWATEGAGPDHLKRLQALVKQKEGPQGKVVWALPVSAIPPVTLKYVLEIEATAAQRGQTFSLRIGFHVTEIKGGYQFGCGIPKGNPKTDGVHVLEWLVKGP